MGARRVSWSQDYLCPGPAWQDSSDEGVYGNFSTDGSQWGEFKVNTTWVSKQCIRRDL